jgi:hypothetical protein
MDRRLYGFRFDGENRNICLQSNTYHGTGRDNLTYTNLKYGIFEAGLIATAISLHILRPTCWKIL